MDVRVGLWRKLSAEELMLLNCGVEEDSWESLGLQGVSHQSILTEISPGCSLEGLMLKLKLQYFGHLMWKANSFGKTLMLGKIEGRRRGDDRGWDGWMASPTQWTWVWVNFRRWWWTGRPGVLWSMGSKRVRHHWALNWTERWPPVLKVDFPYYSINLSSYANIHNFGYIILLWDGVLSSVGTNPPFPKNLVHMTCNLPWSSHFISSSFCSVFFWVLCSATS